MAERRVERTRKFDSNVKRLAGKYRDFPTIVDDFLNTVAKRDTLGVRIPGVGGEPFYKARLRLPGTGKRGGARIIYYRTSEVVLAMYAYAKSDTEDVPVAEIRAALSLLKSNQRDSAANNATAPRPCS